MPSPIPAVYCDTMRATTMRKYWVWVLLLAGVVGSLAQPTQAQTDPVPIRAILITGGHEHDIGFYSIFDAYKDTVRITVSSSGIAFAKDFRDRFDVLITYDFSRDLDETGKKNLRDFVESGKGIVVLHHALLDYQGWPWWYEDVVGGSYRLQKNGDIPSSTYKGDQRISVTLEGKHPITKTMEPFEVMDETYKR